MRKLERITNLSSFRIVLLIVGVILAMKGYNHLLEHQSGFKPIFPDGIQIYGGPNIEQQQANITMEFFVNDGTQYKSSFSCEIEFQVSKKQNYTFYIAMPYRINWVQRNSFDSPVGIESWTYQPDPSGGTLITVTYIPKEGISIGRLSNYFGFDEPVAVQDRGQFTAIIPIHLPSNVNVPLSNGIERLDSVPTIIDVSIPRSSIPSGDSYPPPDQIIFIESNKSVSKHMMWHFDFSNSSEPGQTVLASYIVPNIVDKFNKDLFWAALWLSVGIPMAVTSLSEMLKERNDLHHKTKVLIALLEERFSQFMETKSALPKRTIRKKEEMFNCLISYVFEKRYTKLRQIEKLNVAMWMKWARRRYLCLSRTREEAYRREFSQFRKYLFPNKITRKKALG